MNKKNLEDTEKTLEDELDEKFPDEEIRNFQIENMDMGKLGKEACEIIGDTEGRGIRKTDLCKKLKLNDRDVSKLTLRLEKRGLISKVKILDRGGFTYHLIIEIDEEDICKYDISSF
tara:strand:- start:77 stop:427 length:351 start_codon:yes stop_codon:yes gene_type:complete